MTIVIAPEESVWKVCIGMVIMLIFMGVGIGHIVHPDYFIKRSGIRRGGEMLGDWNRTGIQFFGLVLTVSAGGVLYELMHALLAK